MLAVALEIVDRDGVDGLSMRRLGETMGPDAMALYRHEPNKAAVLDDIAEIGLEQLSADTADTARDEQLRAIARGRRQWVGRQRANIRTSA